MKDYLVKDNKLKEFITDFPSLEAFDKQFELVNFNADQRSVLVTALKKQYTSENLEVPNVLDELLNDNTYTVTTGHQLALFGGPKYFLHKIVSIINLASDLSAKHADKKILPVFWLASEDHDYEEINSLNQFGTKVFSKKEATGPVGRLNNDFFEEALEEFKVLLGTSSDALRLIKAFEDAFQTKNWTAATRYWVQSLFGDQLIIIDGDDSQLKAMYSNQVKDELLNQSSYQNIIETNEKLNQLDYHIQVEPRNINLFYIEDGVRERIVKTEIGYAVLNTSLTFSEAEILQLLENNPEKISPNAILRPLYEESILPNLAYIGGPGELAFWLQL